MRALIIRPAGRGRPIPRRQKHTSLLQERNNAAKTSLQRKTAQCGTGHFKLKQLITIGVGNKSGAPQKRGKKLSGRVVVSKMRIFDQN